MHILKFYRGNRQLGYMTTSSFRVKNDKKAGRECWPQTSRIVLQVDGKQAKSWIYLNKTRSSQ